MLVQLLITGKAIYDLHEANDNKKNADNIRKEAFEKISENQLRIKSQAEKTDLAMGKLANRRRSIYEMSFPEFIKIVDILELIDPSDDNKKISTEIKNSFEEFTSVKNMHSISKTNMKNSEALSSYLLFGIGGYIKKKIQTRIKTSTYD